MRFRGETDPFEKGGSVWWKTVLLIVYSAACSIGSGDEDPAARWVSAYGWIQTGDRLAEAELWPLAIGTYMESHRQISELAAAHPSYEPEVVQYRLEKLEADIASAQENLVHGEHDIMMKYIDFIESFDTGLKQRFAGDFHEALTTLDFAATLLEEIVGEKPAEFEKAVASQQLILQENRDWLDQQVNFEARSRAAIVAPSSADLGTTRFIKASDLPKSSSSVEPHGTLFPGVEWSENSKPKGNLSELASSGESEEPTETESSRPSIPRFRMSSKSKPSDSSEEKSEEP